MAAASAPVVAQAPVVADGSGTVAAEVVGDDEFLSADEIDQLPAERPVPGAPTAPAPGTAPTTPRGSRWGLAPVRWGGVLSAGFRQNRSDGGGSSNTQVYEGRLRVNTYIMQPYIALVAGDFGLSLLRSGSGGGDGSAVSNNLTGTAINGSGSLNIFPQSRFPFQATVALSDSRTDGSFSTTDTKGQRLSLQQSYRPEVGRWRASGQYDRSTLSGSFGSDVVNRLGGDFATDFDRHGLSLNGSWSNNVSEEGTTTDLAGVMRHSFRHSDELSFDTTGTYTTEKFDLDSGSFIRSGDTRSAQIFSFASWTPLDSPWRGTANLRYFDNASNFGDDSFQSRNLGGSASLSYQASNNLSLFGVFSANSNQTGEDRSLTTSQVGGLSYSGDPHMFGETAYSWYGSGSVSNSTASEGDAQRSVDGSLGHSLQRTWVPSEVTQLSASFNQSVSTNRSTGFGATSSSSLNNTVSLSLNATPSDELTGFVSASLSDSRVFGDSKSSFQLLNLQMSGNWRINAYSQLGSNMTWQLTRNASSTNDEFAGRTQSGSQSNSLSGDLNYAHTRAFGVRNLRYTAAFRANTGVSSTRQSGDPNAGRERVTLDLDQRLNYRIGRLNTELQLRVGEIEGRRESLIYFNVSRDFGGF